LAAIAAGVCAFACVATVVEATQQPPPNPPPAQQAPPVGSNPLVTPPQEPRSYPVCIHCPRPDYTSEAKKKKIQGDVWLETFVTNTGKATEIKVTRSLGYGLDEEAIKAVKGWKFRPAVDRDGKAIGTWTSIQIQFQLFN
jgi:TonB family protein